MNQDLSHLPVPEPEARELSEALARRLREEIDAADGWIGFERFVERALYEPGLGYYSAGSEKFGPTGDFITAPALGNTLARALAAQFAPSLRDMQTPEVLELGAGAGTLARQWLEALRDMELAGLPYRILEPSAELADRQRKALSVWGDQVQWLDRLPEVPFDGLIFANEVVDALPATCFVKRRGRAVPLGVTVEDDGFGWAEGPEDAALGDAVAAMETRLGRVLPDGYRSEIRLQLAAWMQALGQSINRGTVCFIDYGYSRRDYYHPERSSGTLVAHYRHRLLDDPFFLPGLVDLTAWVDFSALADAAIAAGFEVAGYTTQGQFLVESLGAGLVDVGTTAQALSALKTLLLPGEMGERFKLIVLAKGCSPDPLPGRDFRDRLF